ncbi:MAG: hypothetical protein ABIJ95_00940 [Pseudomonadota bacterium]
MGRAEIIAGGSGGLYTLRLVFARDRMEAEMAALDARIAALVSRLAAMPDGPEKEIHRLYVAGLRKRWAMVRNRILALEMPLFAWCADRTENLSGQVATAEVLGERGVVQIRPGYAGAAEVDTARDGILANILEMSAPAACLAYALFPSWQKWMPTYRHGRITRLRAGENTADVVLPVDKSSARAIPINTTRRLYRVPIVYMFCHAAAFRVGDEVLVEFVGQDWASPRLIGFRKEPRACGFVLHLTRGDGTPADADMASVNVQIYDADANPLDVTKAWDADLGAWLVPLDNPADYELGRYWVRYSCTSGLTTQYPGRYKTADQWAEADLVGPGVLADTIPFWEMDLEWTPDVPVWMAPSVWDEVLCDALSAYEPTAVDRLWVQYPGEWAPSTVWLNSAADITRRLTVRSSVPYRVAWGVLASGQDQDTRWHLDRDCSSGLEGCPDSGPGTVEWEGWGATVETDRQDPASLVDTLNSSDFAANIPGGVHDLTATDTTAPLTIVGSCPDGSFNLLTFKRSGVSRAVFSLNAYWNI